MPKSILYQKYRIFSCLYLLPIIPDFNLHWFCLYSLLYINEVVKGIFLCNINGTIVLMAGDFVLVSDSDVTNHT